MRLNQYEWDPENDIIAEGAFAEVFKARDTNSINRFVALKIYKQAVSKGTSVSSGQKKYSLEKEFQNVDGLSHSNIISYFGLDYIKHTDAMGRSSSYAVLIMEFAEGGTLKDFMRTKPNKELLNKIIKDILYGVRYLHNEGIIHRDLKPGNILITKNRKGVPIAKITDFGISKDTFSQNLDDKSITEGVGTPHYMAPEQRYKKKFGLNGEISNRTDIWAVGVIIYRLLTGRLPFGPDSRDYDYVHELIVNDEPDYLKVPKSYVNFLKACFQKHASERPRNVNELLGLFNSGDTEKTIVDIDDLPTELVVENKEFLKTNFDDTDFEEPTVVDNKNEERQKADISSEPTSKNTAKQFWAWSFDTFVSGSIFFLFYYLSLNGYHSSIRRTIYFFIAFFIWILYFVYCEYKKGYTMGKYFLGLSVRSTTVKRFTFKNSIIRNLIKGLSTPSVLSIGFAIVFLTYPGSSNPLVPKLLYYFILMIIVYLVSIMSKKTLHDYFSSTETYFTREKEIRYKNFLWAPLLASIIIIIGVLTHFANNRTNFKELNLTTLPGQPYLFQDAQANKLIKYKNVFEKNSTGVFYQEDIYREGLILVKHEDKYGFVNRKGEEVIKPQFDDASLFYSGLARVEKNGEKTMIDKEGNKVFSYDYDYIGPYSEGLAAVRKSDRWGYIDTLGREIIELKYDSAKKFENGKAKIVNSDGQNGVINRYGEETVFHDDTQVNTEYLYINTHDRFEETGTRTTLKFEKIKTLSEGLIGVQKYRKWGYVTDNGSDQIPFSYDDANNFSEGLAAVKKDKWGFITKEGHEQIPLIYDGIDDFSEGLAAVKQNGKWGFINSDGKNVIPNVYDYSGRVSPFKNGVSLLELNGKWGFIDKRNNHLTGFVYDKVRHIEGGLYKVEIDDKYGAISFDAGKIKFRSEVIYDKFCPDNKLIEGFGIVSQNGKMGFINSIGEEAIPLVYDEVYNFSEGLAYASIGGFGITGYKAVFLNKSGKEEFVLDYNLFHYPIYNGGFKNGLCLVGRSIKNNYMQGFINRRGEIVVDLSYKHLDSMLVLNNRDSYLILPNPENLKTF